MPEPMTWQPVPSRQGYEVSSCGLVRKVTGEPVGQWLNNQGYAVVRLSNPRSMARVHRLVAEAFLPNPDGLPEVNHLNNQRADNRVGNLEWCTHWQNIEHAAKQSRMCRDYWTGKRSPNAKFSDEQVASIRADYTAGGISYERLGRKYSASKRAIGRIVNGETYVRQVA